ncbi:hypothetical protein P3W85_41585 [Cupriavidus basilensis]|uniref:Uncharacterized protein n=1 Tax=Cupriavidus basilensis TaxID=68895 RepID=A0ABT6B3D1_9BURK|nr:hypothetical protein [Cupriavidus basilensis]MDF3839387.1 hypothetical protein [Cupriavidus basilensis]
MDYPAPSYFRQSVGEQLLTHYAQRDAVRRSTPLLPVQWAGLRALFRRSCARGHKAV